MLELIRQTTTKNNGIFYQLMELYELSFPETERRSIHQLEYLVSTRKNMFFNAMFFNGELCGLFVYWDMEDFYYLEHLAVFPHMLNKQIGTHLLEWVEKNLQGLRIMEVEPEQDEISSRRIGFYKRNNYKILDTNYTQPSYNTDYDEYPMWIMGNSECNRLENFITRIKEEAYFKPKREMI